MTMTTARARSRDNATNAVTYRLVSIDTEASTDLFALSPVIAEAVALSVGTGQSPPTIVVRRQMPYALLGPKDKRLPWLEKGLAVLTAAGLPVYERIAGGSAVILDHGCVSFAVARPCRDLTSIHRNFDELTVGVRLALRRLGVESEFGAAPGSFCEGGYDLVSGGRKIAGVAQALRRGFTLVSGMVLVSQNPVTVTDLLNEFYAAAGGAADLIPDNVVNLSRLLQRVVTVDEVEQALREGFAQVHQVVDGTFSSVELDQAASLSRVRRIA